MAEEKTSILDPEMDNQKEDGNNESEKNLYDESDEKSENIDDEKSDENLLKQFGEAGHRKYLNNYTWAGVVQKIVGAITSVR